MATTTAVPKTKISGGSFLLEERQTADVFTPEDFSEQHQMIGQTTGRVCRPTRFCPSREDRTQGFLDFARSAEKGRRPRPQRS